MTKYVLTSNFCKGYNHAGPKAKEDINYFLEKEGYHPLVLKLPTKRLSKLTYSLFKLPHLFKKETVNEIVFQYPLYSVFLTKEIIKTIRKKTNAKIIMIVHDYESLRKYKGDPHFLKDETQIFNAVDCLIIHTLPMKQKMKANGIQTPMVVLKLFDYLNTYPLFLDTLYDHSICFAGNLEKSTFLTKLHLIQCYAYLFGIAPAKHYPQNVKYEGAYPANQLPKYLKGDFGLVWDGASLDEKAKDCGTYAYYQRYNAPHKASLYLSCGMPLIVADEAALSSLVRQYHIGLIVSSLDNLNGILLQLSQKEYKVMKENAIKLGKKLRNGMMIKTALQQAERIVSERSE